MIDIEAIEHFLYDDAESSECLDVWDLNDEEILFRVYSLPSRWMIQFDAESGPHLASKGGTYPELFECSWLGVEASLRFDCVLTADEVVEFAKALTDVEELSPPWEWVPIFDALIYG